MGTLHEYICVFMAVSCWILLTMRNVTDIVAEKIKIQIVLLLSSLPPPPPPSPACQHWIGALCWPITVSQPQVSLMVSTGFFFLLVRSFLVFSVIYYWAFCLYVVNSFFCIPIIFPLLGLCLVHLQSLCLCKICPSVSCCFSHIFHPCYCNSSSSFAVMVKFWLPYNGAGRTSIPYSFILVFFEVFCGLNMMLIMPVILQ